MESRPFQGVGHIFNSMKAFLEYVLKNLVDSPESVSVQQVSVSGKTTLEVRVRPGDVGKVVGKQGQTIAAIRSIINAAAARYGGRVEVEIVEDADKNLYVVGAYRERLVQGHQQWLTGLDKNGSIVDGSNGPRMLWPARYVGLRGQQDVDMDSPRNFEAVNIEAVQHQSTFVREMLSETRLPARPIRPDRDKVVRSRALAARYEAGKVFHLRGGPGISTLEAEMLGFPNSEHDDMVDALVYAADVGGVGFYFTSATRFAG